MSTPAAKADLQQFSSRFSDQEITDLLSTFTQDMKIGMARNAAHQQNLRLYKLAADAALQAERGQTGNFWLETQLQFSENGLGEVDLLACAVVNCQMPPTRVSETDRYPSERPGPGERPDFTDEFRAYYGDQVKSFAKEYVDAQPFGRWQCRCPGQCSCPSGDVSFFITSQHVLLVMAVMMDDLASARLLLSLRADHAAPPCLKPAIANLGNFYLDGELPLVSPYFVAVLHGSEQMLDLLRAPGLDIHYSGSIQTGGEPMLACAANSKGKVFSLCDLIDAKLVILPAARMSMLIKGVVPDNSESVQAQLGIWMRRMHQMDQIASCVDTGLYKHDPEDFVIKASGSDHFMQIERIAQDVNWQAVEERTGLTLAQRAIWNTLNNDCAENKLIEVLAAHVDMPALLLAPDAKGSCLFDQIAKSMNTFALKQAVEQLGDLPPDKAGQVAASAIAMLQARKGYERQKEDMSHVLRSWMTNLHAKAALAEMMGTAQMGLPKRAAAMAHR